MDIWIFEAAAVDTKYYLSEIFNERMPVFFMPKLFANPALLLRKISLENIYSILK